MCIRGNVDIWPDNRGVVFYTETDCCGRKRNGAEERKRERLNEIEHENKIKHEIYYNRIRVNLIINLLCV